ncbi:MAG TPA: putative cytokinetic ring protein SteA [Nocardioidaceae bacterium]|nr:putative cytokinetic ring protein SteA [Nocardioidaceae bacterium]
MKFPTRQNPPGAVPGLVGTARVDRRTSSVVRRLRPGDIAVIDHLDLDRASAEALVERGVAAVVNASPSISGRYPNLGPEVLTRHGVLLVDDVGPEVFGRLQDGTSVRIDGGQLLVKGEPVGSGRQLDAEAVDALMEEARSGLSTQLTSFTHNTTEFLRREQDLLLHGRGVPQLRTALSGRPVVVVVRGYDYREDLRRLRRFIREQRPVLIGVDAGADALLAAGHRPDLVVVGQDRLPFSGGKTEARDNVSRKGLWSAKEVVLHTEPSGVAAGRERLDRIGLQAHTLAASATTEDVALLVADLSKASVIITVGMHATLEEFLDGHRSGLASTFLTRLRVGPRLVDAKGVPQLYSGRARPWHLVVVLLAGLLALAVALAATPVGHAWWLSLQESPHAVVDWFQGLIS